MNEIKSVEVRDLIASYGVFLRKRESMKEKTRFIKQVIQDFEPLGYKVMGLTEKAKFITSMNIHIGDVSGADVLIVTHYDIPFKKMFENSTLFSKNKWLSSFVSENIILFIIIAFEILLFYLGNVFNQQWVILLILLSAPLLIVIAIKKFPKGLRDRNNRNRTSSSIITALVLAHNVNKNNLNKVAFVMTDNEYLNHHGDLMLKKFLDKKNATPFVLYLGPTGSGNCITLSATTKNLPTVDKMIAEFNDKFKIERKSLSEMELRESSLASYENSIGVQVIDNSEEVSKNANNSLMKEIHPEVIDEVVRFLIKLLNNIGKLNKK